MFLLTGSANVLTMSRVSETLAGRVALHELLPFSWAEAARHPPSSILEALFDTDVDMPTFLKQWGAPAPDLTTSLSQQVLRGGYPVPASLKSATDRHRWFLSYLQTYVERDIRAITAIEHLPDFRRLLTLLAGRTGGLLHLSAVARDLGLPYTTVRRYVNVLISTYQIFLLPSFATNLGRRVMHTPKLFLTDSGLACHLSNIFQWEDLVRQGRLGPMLETWVANELRKLLTVLPFPLQLYGWRTYTGREVDFLLTRGEDIVAIEVKAARRVTPYDLQGLAACRELLGGRLRRSVLLYPGTEAIALNADTVALPLTTFFGLSSPLKPHL